MPTITPTVLPALAMVRLDVDFSDIDSPYAYVTRTDQTTGLVTPVRLHGQSTTISGLEYMNLHAGYKGVLYDVEAPLDTPVTYAAASVVSVMNANTSFEVPSLDPWIVSTAGTTISLTNGSFGQPAGGDWTIQMHTDGTAATPQFSGELVPATVGSTWSFSMWVESNSISVSVGIKWRTSTGAFISASTTTATIPAAATFITFTGVAPATTAFAQPFVQANGTPASTMVVIADLLTMTTPAGNATSATVVVPSNEAVWLKDPANPGASVRVNFCFDPAPDCIPSEGIFWQSMDTESFAANAAAFNVNNQAAPVVVSKARSSLTSTLTLVTRTFVDRDRLEALLAPGVPLLLQVPDEYGVPDEYMSIGNVSVSRVLPDHRYQIRVFGLPFVVAVAPSGPSSGTVGARWMDTCNQKATWGAVTSAAITWQQVLQGAIG